MAHSVRRIIIIIRRTFTFTVSKITVILYLEKIGGAVEMKLLRIPVGVSDFAEIRRNGYYYVDKSGLIGELLGTTGTKVTLITRPRRFGKTLGMSMLESFFDIRKDNKTLFEGLEIANRHDLCTEWMNQWPTVFVSFRQVDGLNFNSAYGMLTLVISELYKKHLYLLDSDKVDGYDKEIVKQLIQGTASAKDTKGSLMLLTRLMCQQYGKPVILLIDEYDVPVAKANSNGNYIVDDSIRPIVAEAPVAPNEARMKVYIIPDLDLSVNTVIQVQNILLKVIEEPPEHTAIILTARSKEIFLPTIISRVLSLGMTSVTEAESMACLQEKYPAVAPALISEAVSAGRGNIGRCVEYLEHSQFFDSVKLARGLCDAMCGGNEYDVLKTLFVADGKKTLLREGLSLFQEILRDSTAFRLGGESEKSVSCAKDGAKTLSRSLSSDQAVRLYDIVSDYIGRIDANCNISLTINSLAGQIYSVTGK